jgi:hypothetical protein
MYETESLRKNGTTSGGIVSSEELKYGMSDKTETDSNDNYRFTQWAESITATRDALKTLVAHPDYSLHQAKEHVREGNMAKSRLPGSMRGDLLAPERFDEQMVCQQERRHAQPMRAHVERSAR